MKNLIYTALIFFMSSAILSYYSKLAAAPITKNTITANRASDTIAMPKGAISIKKFGAKPNNSNFTNDAVFSLISNYVNKKHGHVTLFIPSGIYYVKAQSKDHWWGSPVFDFVHDTDIVITGNGKIKYVDNLYYGSFDPATDKAYQPGSGLFVQQNYGRFPGAAISLTNCKNVRIEHIEVDGNNKGMKVGGKYGDTGIQLPHVGIFVYECSNVTLTNIYAHHFGQDGIEIINHPKTATPDNIKLTNVVSEYNGRQGLSWTGGNYLSVVNSKFNHTGKANVSSAPGAGLDIEAEDGPITNGNFKNCEFIDNIGCGMVADSGPSSDCHFDNCTFWGTDSWSAWVVKPGFSFYNCRFFGSEVKTAENPQTLAEGTKFIRCLFQDSAYKGKPAYGRFLAEINNARYALFDSCTFVRNHPGKLLWIEAFGMKSDDNSANDMCIIRNSKFYYNTTAVDPEGWSTIMRLVVMKNNTFYVVQPTGIHTERSLGEQPKVILKSK